MTRAVPPPRVGVSIVNYCSAEQTVQCVRALQAQTHPLHAIVVVDNASPDDSLTTLQRALPEVAVLASERNGGYAAGNNLGLRQLWTAGCDYFWIVTPDVIVKADTLARLLAVIEPRTDVGIIGPVIQAGDQFIYASRVAPQLGFFASHSVCNSAESRQLPDLIESDYADGGVILIRRAVLDQIGLLREDFFLYYDETEFCLRARDHGWRVAITGQTTVETRSLQAERPTRDYYMVRNSIVLSRVRRRYLSVTVARQLVSLLPLMVRCLREGRWSRLPRHWAAIWDGLRAVIAVDPPKPVPTSH